LTAKRSKAAAQKFRVILSACDPYQPVVFSKIVSSIHFRLELTLALILLRLLLVLLLIPSLARASGAEMLGTIYLQFAVVAVCIIVPSIFMRAASERMLVAGLVLAGVAVEWLITLDMPYSANKVLANILSVVFPLAGLLIAYSLIYFRRRASRSNDR
jgi:hypothetical protein